MKDRLRQIDQFKGLYIVIIMIWHICVWFYSNNDKMISIHSPDYIKWFVSEGISKLSFGAVSLPFIAGISACFSLSKKNQYYYISRGLFLICLGYLLNFLTFGFYNFEDTFAWDALQFVGFCLIFFPYINKLNSVFLVILVLISPIIPTLLETNDHYLFKILFGDVNGNNYYPILPWISAFVTGIIWFRYKDYILTLFVVSAFGLLLASFFGSFFTVDLNDVWGANMFMPKYHHFFGGLFRAIILLQFLMVFKLKIPFIENFGKYILAIYCSHAIFIVNFIKIFNPESMISCYLMAIFLLVVFSLLPKSKEEIF